MNEFPLQNYEGTDYILYFSYGSNLNKSQMEYRCPKSFEADVADLEHYHLLFRGNSRGAGVATVEPMEGEKVAGGIWFIHPDDLPSLDRYEGFPFLYERKNVIVRSREGFEIEVLTYYMHDHFPKAVPSQGYVDTIVEGYKDFGIDTKEFKRFLDHHLVTLIKTS